MRAAKRAEEVPFLQYRGVEGRVSGKASWRKWQKSRGMEGAEELARRGGKQRGWGRAPRPEQRLEVGIQKSLLSVLENQTGRKNKTSSGDFSALRNPWVI